MTDTQSGSPDALVAVTLARMEGKLDRLADKLADLTSGRVDHEARIRAMESKAVVTPRMLATTLALMCSVGGTVAAFLALVL